jgi:hypothetical protein
MTPWWVWLLIVLITVIAFVGLMAAMHEMNPDPGWRAREAEIRRLRQEKKLRELRGD